MKRPGFPLLGIWDVFGLWSVRGIGRGVLFYPLFLGDSGVQVNLQDEILTFLNTSFVPYVRKRIRDVALCTFIYHYTFAAKSKSLII